MLLFKNMIAQFFSPVSLSLEITIAGLLLLYLSSKQRIGKVLVLIGVSLLAFCSYTPTSDILIDPLIKKYSSYKHANQGALNQETKIVVVLGAGHSNDNNILPVTSRIGYDSMVRLIEGIRIYRMMPEGKLLLSGGSEPGTISSAQDMAQLAKELGVNENDIIIESKSRDTEDEAYIIRSMIGEESFVLVTSSVHMPRSMALFRKNGMKPIPAPTRSIEERIYYRGPDPFYPSSVNLEKSEMAFHEYLGIIWAKLRMKI
jgi:uncharacterized SAM-binding protein YcdF (DUF218 family)